jgi:hypothetical protein
MLTFLYFNYLDITLAYHIFLHLLSMNHKCTQPCYFPLLLKPIVQKEKMDWNSSMRSSRLHVAPVAVPVELWSLSLFCFTESHHSLERYYLCNNYTLFMIFSYLWTLLAICVEQLMLGHAYDEYLVLAKKSGMTPYGTNRRCAGVARLPLLRNLRCTLS